MKLALGLMFTNEIGFLKLHLPIYKNSFDGIVALTDPRTTDGSTEFLWNEMGAAVMEKEWSYDWGDFATTLCRFAEEKGYDAIMRMDPDECLMPQAGSAIKLMLERTAALLCFPRHEFFGDRTRARADLYPDYQARAWHLNRGIRVQGKRHEGVGFAEHGLSEHTTEPKNRVYRLKDPYLHIFHYGWIGREGIYRNQVKYQSHAQVEAGGPPEVNFGEDFQLVDLPTIPFTEPQPIDPEACGIYAPFKE